MSSRADEVQVVRFGLWWPDGRPDQLRARAAAWRRMAVALTRCGEDLLRARQVVQASCQGAAIDAYLAHQQRVLAALNDEAEACIQLARSLEDFADAIDAARHRLLEMAAEIAASMAIGFGLAMLTAGISAAAAETVTAAMIAEAGVMGSSLTGQAIAIAIASRVVVMGAFGAGEAGATNLIVQVERNAVVNQNHNPLEGIELPELLVSGAGGFVVSGAFAGLTTPVPRSVPPSRIVLDDVVRDYDTLPGVVRPSIYWAEGAEWSTEQLGVVDQDIDDVARLIGRGHAYVKHLDELPWIGSREELSDYVASVMRHPSEMAPADGGRIAYWDAAHDAIVIVSPRDADLGTVFVPDTGYDYFVQNFLEEGQP
ncbi:MAG: hypothetical protein JWN67_304 [Actinomycetia bacterium]|nr:hypothetical protein [Actinomycetes bacterium]